ncbi:MAG: hypothetical protein GXP25_20270 [Planctomycetes bacterium]|nr:hypothetical protein [Planctomycetota bacterium]
MSDSDTPNASQPEKPKPEQKELLPSEEEKEEAPAMDIPGMGISADASSDQAETASSEAEEKGKEPPTLDVPSENEKENLLEEKETEEPKPPDLSPSTPPPPPADQAAPDAKAKEEEERYEAPPAFGEFLGNQLKDLGLGGQISLAGSVLCFVSSFFWSWQTATGGAAWFTVLVILLLSIEALALVCLHMPDRLAEHRDRMKDILFVVAGHIVALSLIALLLNAKGGPVVSLVGGLVVCAGNYIWLLKSKPTES